jgi:hypothetical protein
VQVPKGRGPFASWEDSAIDALELKKLSTIRKWSIERIAYTMEQFNGFGYRRSTIDHASPYLWSGTCHYERGKFVADGRYNAATVSSQPGGMPILKAVAAHCGINLVSECGAIGEAPSELTSASYRKAEDVLPATSDQKPLVQSTTAQASSVSTVASVYSAQAVIKTELAAAQLEGSISWGKFALGLLTSEVFLASMVAVIGMIYVLWDRNRRSDIAGIFKRQT